MAREFRSELIVPNEAGALGLVRTYVQELATQAALAAGEAPGLARAVERLCETILQYGFEAGDDGTLRLVGTLNARTLSLALHERGVPFDPAAPAPTESLSAAGGVWHLASGAVWDQLHGAVDEARWLNHGKAGMELRLVKHRPHQHVAEHLPAEALVAYAEDEPLAPPQDYAIRRMRPEEAIQVAQCIYRAYGYSYGNADLYYPARLAHLNEAGQLISIVAVDEAGAVVGHLALERPEPRPVAESGAAVVAPAHRGRRLLQRLRASLEDEARGAGLLGVFGEPVTSHVYSQRTEESFGAHPCGVLLGGMPRSTRFKHIRAHPLGQRESNLIYFKYLTAPTPMAIHAPDHHRPLLERIYAGLETPIEFRPPAAPHGPGEMHVSFDHSWQCGEIRVRQVGADTAAGIARACRDLTHTTKAEVVYLELPLAQAGTPAACQAAEAAGFFFAGLGVRWAPDGDVLILQHLQVPLDPARLQIASPFAQELVAYAAAERERVSASGPGEGDRR